MLKYIFKFFNPKNVQQAAQRKLYLSVVYAFVGWNTFIYMFYKIVIEDQLADGDDKNNAIISKLSAGQTGQVIRIEEFKVTRNEALNSESLKTEKKDEELLEV